MELSPWFPKERSGRWRGLGLLVGGRASMELAEVKTELQESKNENLRLWSVIKTLEKNQSSLEDKHNELKAMLLASQGHEKAGSNHKIVQEPKEDLEDMVAINNEEKESPTSSRGSKRSKVKSELVEKVIVSTQQIPKKGQPTQQEEKVALSLQQNREDTVADKNLHKKQRKFQTPLPKGGLTVFKHGLEVGLISPQSTSMVAFATIQATDSKSKATDGQPLGDCVEVLINTVFSKTTLLPRSQGNISKLSNAVGRCIQWPRKNVESLHDGSGDGPTPKVSVNGAIKENSSKRRKVKNSSSITSPAICT